MIRQDLSSPSYWADRFGLALAPLFEGNEPSPDGNHCVLLDGGFGSFALSVSEQRIWEDRAAADWSWSSNLPHHVTVTDREVAVVRWDEPKAELLTRTSVQRQMSEFYRYLAADRVQSTQRVTDHMLMVFRRVRSLVADARIDDDRSIDAFLAFLAYAIEQPRQSNDCGRSDVSVHSEGADLLRSLSASGVENLLEDVTSRSSSGPGLALVPSLAVRHAGSEIFQEAHFELHRTSSPDLFGYIGPSKSRQVTRGSTHFTPPALARSIVEQALAQLPGLADRERLTILDPACGSGSFLHEALRTLRRSGFRGRLILVGRDTSRPAVSMARFVLDIASADWSPEGGCEIDIQQGDSLSATLPQADVVLMNPPFVAWFALTAEQRQQMQDILGPRLHGRGDLSMAFVARALEHLTPGGVLGTLLPGSLLTLQAAEKWRKHLLDQSDLRLIASLGDYGLFSHAQVHVAAAVLVRPRSRSDKQESVTALVAANNADATGDALRTLRGAQVTASGLPRVDKSWRLFHTTTDSLRRQATWRLASPQTERALCRLMDMGRAVPIGDIFNVREGAQTGLNSVFVLTTSQVEELPKREREWFLPAIVNDSIKNGQVEPTHRVFFPYDEQGLAIKTEVDLARLLPTYFDHYLQPARTRLARRAAVRLAKRPSWWILSRRRRWALDSRPRLVSKHFGGPGGFAADLDARYIVVQGFVWFPKWPPPASGLLIEDALAAYMAVMNSTPFARLLEIFSPRVAGGQFDLSIRYVKAIPVPDLPALFADERANRTVTRLVELGREPRFRDRDWRDTADRLTTKLFGGDIFSPV
ncbi:MAG: N-6 DNA methylase [Gemmatimonadota bacterium]|nr:N-6 DNA methylase [Gemmatimonadota bacterium]MDE2865297.1 N-6 DNA methylase [Gemmatimonadota bacterium]